MRELSNLLLHQHWISSQQPLFSRNFCREDHLLAPFQPRVVVPLGCDEHEGQVKQVYGDHTLLAQCATHLLTVMSLLANE